MAPALRVKLSTGKKAADPSTPKPANSTPTQAASTGPKIKLFSSAIASAAASPAPVQTQTPASAPPKTRKKPAPKEPKAEAKKETKREPKKETKREPKKETTEAKAPKESKTPSSKQTKTPAKEPTVTLPRGKKRTRDETSDTRPAGGAPDTPVPSVSTPATESKPTIKLSLGPPKQPKLTLKDPPKTPASPAITIPAAAITAASTTTTTTAKPKIQLKSLKVSLTKAKPKPGSIVVGPDGKPKKVPLPNLKIKGLGKPPVRPPGEGYDSEDDEAETDPAIESQIIFRMAPGDDCDYLHRAIAERRIGHPDPAQRAKVNFRFFDKDGRRACVKIRGNVYAAALVDLPCIIEGNKSWDRKNLYKSADICQMLLVLGLVEDEESAKTYPLPREVNPNTWAYPHGITPPMYHVRTRRFRKRVSYHTIEQIESTVEQLLEADRKAKESGGMSEYKIIDENADDEEEEEEEEEDVVMSEMDVDPEAYLGDSGADDNGFDEAALAEMQAALMADDDDDDEAMTGVEPSKDGTGESKPVTENGVVVQAEDDDDDDDDDDEEEEEEEEELDEEALARQNELLDLKEQLDEIHADLKTKRAQLATQENKLLRNRLHGAIERLVQDLDVRRKEFVSRGGVLPDDEADED